MAVDVGVEDGGHVGVRVAAHVHYHGYGDQEARSPSRYLRHPFPCSSQ